MGFKLPGKSIQVGTSGHRSALKMREAEVQASALKMKEQEMASALKMKASPAKSPEYDAAAKKDPNLGSYVTERNRVKAKYKGTDNPKGYKNDPEYAKAQNAINKAYGSNKRYEEGPEKEIKAETKVVEADTDTDTDTDVVEEKSKPKATGKAEEKIEKVTEKATKRKSEIDENLDVKTARAKRKEARKLYGRGSKEHLEAKLKVKEEKSADIRGEKGGRKRGLFRGLASRRNQKKRERLQRRIDKKGGKTKATTKPAETKTKTDSSAKTASSSGGSSNVNINTNTNTLVNKKDDSPATYKSSPAKGIIPDEQGQRLSGKGKEHNAKHGMDPDYFTRKGVKHPAH